MNELTIQKPYDMHVHFRDGDTMRKVVPHTAQRFRGALVMPNLTPPIRTASDVEKYRQDIMTAAGSSVFLPLMTFKILPDTDPDTIEDLARLYPPVAGKVYPKGLTTNAHDGVEDFFALGNVYNAMQKHDLVLCLHGEMPGKGISSFDREQAFLRTLRFLARTYPDLRIVLEHITTAAAVDEVLRLPDNVAATITVHHLLLTYDDVGGDRMCPVNFCKPIAKRESDRAALIEAATSGCPKFFFGSDSAPHPKEGKQRHEDCCAGVFSAPVALELLTEIFERHGALDRLESFVGNFASRFYGILVPLENPRGHIRLVKDSWTVPEEYDGIVPFWAGRTIIWKIA